MAEREKEEKVVVGAGGGDEEEKIVHVGAGGDEEKQIVPVGAGGGDEEKGVVSVGAGNEEQNLIRNCGQVRPPPGFRFRPEYDELVRYYLIPKLQGRDHVLNKAIIEDDVYQCHPNKLTHMYRDRGDESWYFLSPRARKYTNGNRPSRSTGDKSGRWKAATGKTTMVCPLKVAGNGEIKYIKRTLSYFVGPIKREKKSKWLMNELTVPDYEKERGKNGGGGKKDMLDAYVMCMIYVSTKHKGDDDEAGPSGTQSSEPAENGQGTSTAAAGSAKLSEKQAGKRPAEEQNAAATASKRAQAHHPNPDRLNLGPPAPLHGNGMQDPFRAPPGYYGGGPGGAMGHYARPPMQRPPVVYQNGQPPVASNGHVQVPRQPMACNGQRPPLLRQQAACSGQVPVPRQQVAHNGQGPVPRQQVAHNGQVPVPRQQVAHNGQVPVPRQQAAHNGQMMRAPTLKLSPPYRPAGTPNSHAQNQKQTMMTRSPNPAGQAVNPPSSAVPRPALTQKQPETEEMRTSRVIQQHLQEYSRRMQSSTRPPASTAQAAQQRQPTAFTHQQQLLQQQRAMMSFPPPQQHQRPMMAFPPQQQQQQQQQRAMMAFPPQQQQQQRAMVAFPPQQQRQQQRPHFGPNAYHRHHAGAMDPSFPLDNFYASEAAQHYLRSQAVLPPTSGSAGPSGESLRSSVVSGAGGEVSGANRDGSNGDNMKFVESATEGGNTPAADGEGQ